MLPLELEEGREGDLELEIVVESIQRGYVMCVILLEIMVYYACRMLH